MFLHYPSFYSKQRLLTQTTSIMQPENNVPPTWPAPERNKQPILEVLQRFIENRRCALEVGSGTGQHIAHFAQHLPDVLWQPSDQAEYMEGIRMRTQAEALPNLLPPLEFDVNDSCPTFSNARNPDGTFDLLYSANTLHIMGWATVQQFFRIIPTLLTTNAIVVIYGPFNYNGQFTSDSNAAFDASLKARDASMGIRDSESVIELAAAAGLNLIADIEMPANNRSLIFERIPA